MNKKQEDGINAANLDFKKFDQVNKDQNYQLSESNHDSVSREEFDDHFEIKTVDMSALLAGEEGTAETFARHLGTAMQEIGFVVLTGHGIDTTLYQTAEEKITELFETLTLDKKQSYLAERHGSVNQGYFPIKQTTIIHPDLVEGWVFCRRAFNMDGNSAFDEKAFWPLQGYEPFFRQLCQAHEKIILPIMQGVLRYLKCDPHAFDQKLHQPNFGFRLNYYPPLKQEDLNSGAGRMLGHEDVDLFTILPAQDLEGLQVLNRKNMKWIRLHPPKGSIVINTGDYMQRITNDLFPSTTHRVSIPLDKNRYNKARISFPMAVYLWEGEILQVLPSLGKEKYPPVKAIEFHTKTTSKYYGEQYAVSESSTD